MAKSLAHYTTMPGTLYRDANFEGPFLKLQPGFFSGERDLRGGTRGSSQDENLDNKISSVRVDKGYIAVLHGGYSASANSGSRVLIGPTDVPNLAAVGMDDKTSSIRVLTYQPYLSAVPRDFGVTLSESIGSPGGLGIRIGQGSYDRARLDSEEVRLRGRGVLSLCVGSGTIAVLHEGGDFESTQNSVLVLPNTCVEDIGNLGMMGDDGNSKVNSIQVLYASTGEPTGVVSGETPLQRAVRTLGTSVGSQPSQDRHQVFQRLRRSFADETDVPLLRKSEQSPPPQKPETIVIIRETQPSPSMWGKKFRMAIVVMIFIMSLALLMFLSMAPQSPLIEAPPPPRRRELVNLNKNECPGGPTYEV